MNKKIKERFWTESKNTRKKQGKKFNTHCELDLNLFRISWGKSNNFACFAIALFTSVAIIAFDNRSFQYSQNWSAISCMLFKTAQVKSTKNKFSISSFFVNWNWKKCNNKATSISGLISSFILLCRSVKSTLWGRK